jgi:hypothetical protein
MTLAAHANEEEESWDGPSFGLFWENDAFTGTDRHYTQGAGIWYISPDNANPGCFSWLSEHMPAAGIKPETYKYALAFTQEMYTPEDLRSTAVVEDDRPYAGWLYGTLSLRRRGPGWFQRPAIDEWGVKLGVIGPPALAEQTQKSWHGVDPAGWHNQLKTEPGLVFYYDRFSLFRTQFSDSPWAFDFIPSLGAALGNVELDAHLALQLRLGFNIRDDFAVVPPPLRYGFYLFGRVEGRYVAHNIFIDGNTFRDSHSVDRVPWMAEFNGGITVVFKHLEITARQSVRTPEFDGQRNNDTFSAAFITIHF